MVTANLSSMRIRPSSPNRRTNAASCPAWPEGQLAAQGVKVSHNAAWLFLRPEGRGFKKSLFALERGRADISRLHGFAPYGHWRTLTFLGALLHDRRVAPCVIDGPIKGL